MYLHGLMRDRPGDRSTDCPYKLTRDSSVGPIDRWSFRGNERFDCGTDRPMVP